MHVRSIFSGCNAQAVLASMGLRSHSGLGSRLLVFNQPLCLSSITIHCAGAAAAEEAKARRRKLVAYLRRGSPGYLSRNWSFRDYIHPLASKEIDPINFADLAIRLTVCLSVSGFVGAFIGLLQERASIDLCDRRRRMAIDRTNSIMFNSYRSKMTN